MVILCLSLGNKLNEDSTDMVGLRVRAAGPCACRLRGRGTRSHFDINSDFLPADGGRSGRGGTRSNTLGQLARDLDAVIDATTPTGHIVLIGHSIAGAEMSAVVASEEPSPFHSNRNFPSRNDVSDPS